MGATLGALVLGLLTYLGYDNRRLRQENRRGQKLLAEQKVQLYGEELKKKRKQLKDKCNEIHTQQQILHDLEADEAFGILYKLIN